MEQQTPSEVVEGELVEEGGRELAVRPDAGLRAIKIPEFQRWADSRAEALGILMRMGIAQTRTENWSDQDGKPYPEQGACTSMINMVGITISPPARRRENFHDEKGDYYLYLLESEVTVPKFGIGPLPIVGRASSRDPFFALRRGELRPDSEIDPGDIISKAYTNLRYRAVKAVVPQIAKITWDELKEITGGRVARGKVSQVRRGETDEEPQATGNCPTCGVGTLVEKQRRDGSGSFWACSEGKYDAKTKKRTGCQHTQNEPPARAPTPTPNGDSAPPETAGTPNPAVIAVLDVLRGQGKESKGQQMAALAKACQSLGRQMPRGGDPEAWLSNLSDEELPAILGAIPESEAAA